MACPLSVVTRVMISQIPLERFIGNFLLEVPAPSPGRVEVSQPSLFCVEPCAIVNIFPLVARGNTGKYAPPPDDYHPLRQLKEEVAWVSGRAF